MNNEYIDSIKKLITVEAIPLQKHVLNGVKTRLPVLLQVKVDHKVEEEITPTSRPGFDLCIVLDRSGSMAGLKIENSKMAINNIIDNLIPDDTISLVIYDGSVETLFERKKADEKEQLKQIVNEVKALGGTNLYAGMVRGFEVLKQLPKEGNRMKRTFLFSDGLVTCGETNQEVICNRAKEVFEQDGIAISTYGVGSYFDENIMKNVAKNGQGMFFYISNIQEIPKQIAKGLRGLTSTVGTDSYLKLRGMNGSIVESIHNESNQALVKGCFLRELKQGDWKRIVTYVDVHPSHFNPNNVDKQLTEEKGILYYSLNFNVIAVDDAGNQESIPTSIGGTVNVLFTDDDNLVLNPSNVNDETNAAIVVLEVGADDAKVIKYLEENRIDDAIQLKREIIERLEKIQHVDKIAEAIYKLAVTNLSTLLTRNVNQAKKEAVFNKYIEEEEGDMGFGLFD